MGRVAAVVYVPLRQNRTQSWDERFHDKRLRAILRTLSRFYDGLDPMSAQCLFYSLG